MNYILITYDAVLEFASGRSFQSAEYEDGLCLCRILKDQEGYHWESSRIHSKVCKNGIIFFTKKIDRKRGVCFDMSTFTVDSLSDDTVITIFQRTIKYAVKYFENYPLASYEKQLPGTNLTLVYPYPFVASKEVDKVNVDRNSSKLDRKDANYLTVFYFGNREDIKVSHTYLLRAYDELKTITSEDISLFSIDDTNYPMGVLALDSHDLSIDSSIGYEQWMSFVTQKQKRFIMSPIIGPERLEGAAGTGKTLSMILRCIRILKEKIDKSEEYHIIFITHSLATKDRICNIFRINWPEFDFHLEKSGEIPSVSIHVTTLQEWSANHLGTNSILESNYIDKDAAYSKDIQLLYIEQAFEALLVDVEWNGYEPILSSDFKSFIKETPRANLLEMIQREVAVTIKGRAKEDYELYKEIKRPKYGVPVRNDADRNFMFEIFKRYQESLISIGKYDSDDIILSAMGQIDTPIWRRRRITDGYDACLIDETHLFNLNELSLFHFINKPSCANSIVFAIDKSQSVGEWGVDEDDLIETFKMNKQKEKSEKFSTVFRSSHDITCLAFNILSSGATLFTNFENPLVYSMNNFTREEEEKSEQPIYKLVVDDTTMIEQAFVWVEDFIKKNRCPKSSILITCSNDSLLHDTKQYAFQTGRHFEVLESRSDAVTVRKAREAHKYVLGGIDYVGGLEFDAVVIIGVDGQRVPPSREQGDAYHFMRYAWHNRLYVAVTRAKYAICILGVKGFGPSVILENAIGEEYLKYIEQG